VIRAIVCDFGGVLTSPLAGSFRAFSQHTGIPVTALGTALAALHAREGVNPLHELECGRVTERDFLARLAAVLAEQLGREVAMHDFGDHYFAGLAPNAPMIELMATLRGEGYTMACLTNNVREWRPRWSAMAPIDEIFALVVDSAFVGMRKPDREIYELTVRRLGVRAGECLFVDDVEDNCAGAREAGLHAIRYVDSDQTTAHIRAALRDVDATQLSEPSRSQR
jgi:putative hydrolase of the HAD superfamily